MSTSSLDEAFGQHVLKTGMATAEQLREAMRLQAQAAQRGAPISLGQALVEQGAITARQRENVESKLEVRREQVGMLGHFQILKKLGEGGMGAVYLARDTKLDREVALKVMPKEQAKNEAVLKRFLREASAAGQLKHVNIAQAYSLGEDKGYPFYVMEYCEGLNLKDRIKRDGRLPIDETLRIMIQVARGLQYAHEMGFVHRDIKPGNIVVTPKGIAKILDLGLSKNVEDAEQSFRTQSGVAIGTPHYISPEQARGEREIDGRSDIYSLGATAYHLLTGDTPFHGSSSFDIITKHLTEQLRDPQDLREEIPEGVSQIIRRMMAKNPRDRHQSCHGLLPDLELVIDGKEPASGQLDAHLSSVAAPVRRIRPGPATRRVPMADPASPSRTLPLLLGGLAAAAVIIGVVLALSARPAPPPRDPTARKTAGPTRVDPPKPPLPPANPAARRLPSLPPPSSAESAQEGPARREYGEILRLESEGGLPPTQLEGRVDRFLAAHEDTHVAREVARRLGRAPNALPDSTAKAPPPSREPVAPIPTLPPDLQPPVRPATGPAALAYHALWLKAADHALARDYGAALKELEASAAADPDVKADAAADRELFKGVQALLGETLQSLAAWPRGQNLPVEVMGSGERRRIDQPVRRAEPFRADVREGDGESGVEFGEIAAASLADLYLRRAKRGDAEIRAAAALCALEGDGEAARRLCPSLPGKYAERAAEAAMERPRETEARRLFAEAERELRAYPTRGAALEKYARLLADFRDTLFVRRNSVSLASRADSLDELYFAPGDLRPSGAFALARHGKGQIGWTLAEDVADKADRKNHFVEAEFSLQAGSEYRAWAYVGGCCAETFAFQVQATDFKSPEGAVCEPGSEFAMPVPSEIPFLKKLHVQHGGPKAPSRFEWVALPALKSTNGGPRKLRILSDQAGFTVAGLFLSSRRKQPPRESEAAELSRSRPDVSDLLDGTGISQPGVILREVWTGIGGERVADLTSHPAFKAGRPALTSHPTSFEAPFDWSDAYGTRMRGYVHPPLTGLYTFWIASDDGGQLFLSTDASPSNKREICSQTSAVAPRNWNGLATQKSQPLPLVKGRRYYIEALQKDGAGGDHLSVGWSLPNGAMERPIPGLRLSLYVPGSELASGVVLTAPAPGTSVPAPGPIVISADAQGQVSRIDVFQGSTRIGEAKGSPPSLTWNAPAVGAYPLAARFTEKGGRTLASKPVLVTVGEISLYRAVDLNGAQEIQVDELTWEGGAAPDLEKTGTGFERPEVALRGATDAARARMIRSSVGSREGTKARFVAVPPGKYLVYLTAWEPEESPASFDLLVNGKVVVAGHRFSGAGDWARLGPWPVEVSDGTIELASRGPAHFSGVEVWRHGPPVVGPTERARSEIIGGTGGTTFEEAPEGNPLVTGLRVWIQAGRHVKSIQALYRDQAGSVHGVPTGSPLDLQAKPGYAVGGVEVRGGYARVAALRVIFMRISGFVLDPKDRYESEWVVGDAAGTTALGATGSPVVGLCGRRGNDLDAMGLVYLK